MKGNYSPVMQLGQHSDVMLMRELSSDRLVVRRISMQNQIEVYEKIKDLEDKHIPKIYSITDLGNGKYEVLEEYIEGRTLEEILQEKGTVRVEEAAWYMAQLCDALEGLRKAGLVHRDVKPSNLIVTSDERLYLLDFDIARIHKKKEDSDTQILGTMGYAAPEQFGFRQTGAQTDVYAAGVLLNKLLTGKLPNECMPKGKIGYIIRRCLYMDMTRRYRNAGALKRALYPYMTKGQPLPVRILRKIPGFRSLSVIKMIVAVMVYMFIGSCVWLAIPEINAQDFVVRALLWLYLIYCLYLYFFIFDIFLLRSRVKWLERSRGRWTYLIKCVVWGKGIWVAVGCIFVTIITMLGIEY